MKPNTALNPLLTSLFLLLIAVYQPAFAQEEEKLKNLFVEAESYFLFEEFRDALPLYQRILQADPENYNISFKIGICYLNNVYQVNKSIQYLEKAVKGISASSKPTSFRERMAPPEARYYLGNAYRANYRLDDAIKEYEEFKKILNPLVYDETLVDEQIKACKVAALQRNNPMYFISVNLGEGINSRFEEINPVISGDENVLAFTRKLQFYDAVFYSRRENGKWTDPINLTSDFGLDGSSYTTGLSYNGDEMYVYRSDNFDGNIYVSHYRNGKWSTLKKLNNNINTKYWESHATLSKDGKTLYFTSNREGGYGGLDIYRSERIRGDEWGPAVNLGPVINSKYNEDTPFITDDGNTLYFSSMGHYNMGGYDIFYSTRLENGQWAKPVNAGYPLNTTHDDLFFVPVRDGAYAYYSKYDPGDSYGMVDIYKLEVFTELHPRKFILNGIARIEGQAVPSDTRLTATLTDLKTGKIIDQAKLNTDGTYMLNALSGDVELQIKGEGINEITEKLKLPLNNPSNIVEHSSILTPAPVAAIPEQVKEDIVDEPAAGPEMEIAIANYNVTSDKSIPIRIDLERDTKLKVVTGIDGKLIRTENFDIRRRRFVYMLTPQPGINTILFTLINDKGDSTVREVTVVYTPPVEELLPPPTDITVLSDSNRYRGMGVIAGGTLGDFLKSSGIHQMDFKTVADLYDYLIENAAEIGYEAKDVDELFKKFLSQKDLNIFYEELKDHASDSLVKALNSIDPGMNEIFTSGSLLDYLYENAGTLNYNLDELRKTLYSIAALNRSPLELINLFESYSTGELNNLLQLMKQNHGSFADTRSVADHIMKAAENNEFPLEELESMLKQAAVDVNVNFLTQSLIFISSDNLKQTLLDLDIDKQNIRNTRELLDYLIKTADSRNYSKREVFGNVEKVRKDPYYFVDLFRKMLADRASGSLKEFLQEIDVRNLNINTYEQLIDHLLVQSQFHDYNREMVYQLLIDIIAPKNLKEFIGLLRQYADNRIIRALDASDGQSFSKPVEVMQYLLSVSGEYDYTERDLLRVLLKIALSRGPVGTDGEEKHGWLSRADKQAFITSLIVINTIIVLLLVLFFLRRKKKNE